MLCTTAVLAKERLESQTYLHSRAVTDAAVHVPMLVALCAHDEHSLTACGMKKM
jgi:hypothetical protein